MAHTPEDRSAKDGEAHDHSNRIIQYSDNGLIQRIVNLEMDEEGRSKQNSRENDPYEHQPIYLGGQISYGPFGLQIFVEFQIGEKLCLSTIL